MHPRVGKASPRWTRGPGPSEPSAELRDVAAVSISKEGPLKEGAGASEMGGRGPQSVWPAYRGANTWHRRPVCVCSPEGGTEKEKRKKKKEAGGRKGRKG